MLSITRRQTGILLGIIMLISIYLRYSPDSVDLVTGRTDGSTRKTNNIRSDNAKETTKIPPRLHTQDSDIEQRFAKRRLVAALACRRASLPGDQQCRRNVVKRHLHLVGSYNSTLCVVEKAGSTFLKRILKVISTPSKHRKASSPFDYGSGIIFSTERTLGNMSDDSVMERMKTTTNTIFVRNPYTRLFSFYLDKLNTTNALYWFTLGKQIVREERTNPGNVSLTCGHDVTFTELISFLVKKMKNLQSCPLYDEHLSPSYDHCSPCNFNYTYIGKYETLHEDLYHILTKEDMAGQVNFSNWGEQNQFDAFKDGANSAFFLREKIEKCMPFVSGLRRVWRHLQSRGMLDKRSKFPFTEADNTTITQKSFLEAMKRAYRDFDRKDRLLNKQEALSEAYGSLDTSLVKQFYDAFRLDFEIFGYQSSPPITTTTDYKYIVFE